MNLQGLANLVPNARTVELRRFAPAKTTFGFVVIPVPDALAISLVHFYALITKLNAGALKIWLTEFPDSSGVLFAQWHTWLELRAASACQVTGGIGLEHRGTQVVTIADPAPNTATAAYALQNDRADWITFPLPQVMPVPGKSITLISAAPDATDVYDQMFLEALVWR